MDHAEIDFLRTRIALEKRMADEAGTSSAALIHMQLARLYEARLEIEAARLVDEVILEECSVVEPSIQAALRLMA